MDRSSTLPRPCSHHCSRGATLIEVLVALIVATTVIAGTVGMAFSSEMLFQSNERRASVNQALRSSVDLMGNEIREAGVLLPRAFPAVEVVDGPLGTPDELVVRKALDPVVLPVCADLASGGARNNVIIADGGGTPPAGCAPVPDGDSDGWPDNLQAWRTQRVAEGGSINAYIFDPVTRVGEFFEMSGEDAGALRVDVGNGGAWAANYTVAGQARIYLLEEKRFRLNGDLLEIVVDQDASNPWGVQDLIGDLQIRVMLTDGTVLTALSSAGDWGMIETIELTVDGTATTRGQATARSLTASFSPRNVLSL